MLVAPGTSLEVLGVSGQQAPAHLGCRTRVSGSPPHTSDQDLQFSIVPNNRSLSLEPEVDKHLYRERNRKEISEALPATCHTKAALKLDYFVCLFFMWGWELSTPGHDQRPGLCQKLPLGLER